MRCFRQLRCSGGLLVVDSSKRYWSELTFGTCEKKFVAGRVSRETVRRDELRYYVV